MSATLSRRLGALETGRAHANPRGPHNMRLIGANDSETADQAVARWKVENPHEVVPEEREDLINFIVMVPLKPLGARA